MNAEDDGVRYSSRELFDIFLEFLRDKRERQRIYKLDLSPHQHVAPVIVQFIAYVRNHAYEQRMKEMEVQLRQLEEKSKRQKGRMFGEPGDGKLFRDHE